ncbi:hypothetical protein INT44_006594 [Umbelopsis vinacea]|uniref:Uncharacterized protein n=1 Tax=Umbelopsis vinacea TaxID=44442 RepID=A0A8H7PV29_9FUNG|nr:hypothetical protein INT44_006594 [Umbelopsis vinacea]
MSSWMNVRWMPYHRLLSLTDGCNNDHHKVVGIANHLPLTSPICFIISSASIDSRNREEAGNGRVLGLSSSSNDQALGRRLRPRSGEERAAVVRPVTTSDIKWVRSKFP